MLILKGPALASRITDRGIRRLVEQRFREVCAGVPYDYDLHGYMIVVEPGDTVDALEKETSCAILRDLFDDVRFGDPDFSPSFEALEEHHECYEMLFITNDEGFGITLWIQKKEEIAADLLALCIEYATPAPEPTEL